MTNDSHSSLIQAGVDYFQDGMSQAQKHLSEMNYRTFLGPKVVQGYECFMNGECMDLLWTLMPGWVHQLHGYIPTWIFMVVAAIAAWYIAYYIHMTINPSGVRYRDGGDDTNKSERVADILASLQRHFYATEDRIKAAENRQKTGSQLPGAVPPTRVRPQLYGDAPSTHLPPSGGRCNCGAECCSGLKVKPTPVAEITPTKRIRPPYKSFEEWVAGKQRLAAKAAKAAKEGTN